MSGNMEFITITSGGKVMSPRKDVSPAAIGYCRNALATDGHLVDGWWVRVAGQTAGTAVFVIQLALGARKIAVTTCMVCWGADESDSAWEAVSEDAMPNVVLARPRGVPWLAVSLLKDAIELAAAGGAGLLMELADMERCIAWTLIEGARG